MSTKVYVIELDLPIQVRSAIKSVQSIEKIISNFNVEKPQISREIPREKTTRQTLKNILLYYVYLQYHFHTFSYKR